MGIDDPAWDFDPGDTRVEIAKPKISKVNLNWNGWLMGILKIAGPSDPDLYLDPFLMAS